MYPESGSLLVSYSFGLRFRVQDRSGFVRFYSNGPRWQLVTSGWHRSALSCTKNAGQIIVPRGYLSMPFLFVIALHLQHSLLIEIRYFRRLKFPQKGD